MTLSQMGESGYKQTAKEIKQFNTMLAKEYKKSLDAMRNDIKKVYDKVVGDRPPAQLAKLLEESPAWLFTESQKFNRLEGLMKKVQAEYIKASIKAGNMTVESSKLAITNNFYRQQFALDFASPVKLSFTVLNPKVVEISVLGAPKVWKGIVASVKKRIEDKYGDLSKYQPKVGTLTETILKNRRQDLQKIQSAITQGLIQGKSSAQTAKEVKKIMNTSANNAIRIVRTEGARNSNAGNYASHNVAISEGLEVKRQIISVLDDRTREQSADVDAQISDKNDQFTYPDGSKVDFPGNSGNPAYDINDRESVIEIIDGQSPDTRVGRNPVSGVNEQMSFTDFNTWASANNLTRNGSGRLVVRPAK